MKKVEGKVDVGEKGRGAEEREGRSSFGGDLRPLCHPGKKKQTDC